MLTIHDIKITWDRKMTTNIELIRKQLENHYRETPILFFKTNKGDYAEHDQFLGIKVPNLRKIAKQFYLLEVDEHRIFMTSKYNEERLLALIILVDQYQKAKWEQKKKIVHYYLRHIDWINNWNLVDSSAHPILGAYSYITDTSLLMELSSSNKLWEKRIAIVATWYFIKRGQVELTYQIAEQYLNDQEDLIHKATGWMLREAGKVNMHRLNQFLIKHAHHMPRTMLRYAIEKMNEEDRGQFLRVKPGKKHKKSAN